MFANLRWPKTIRAQLMLGFGAILLVSFTSAAIGYSSLQRLRNSSRTTLENAARIRELSLELQSNFLQARQAEEVYLSEWKTAHINHTAETLINANQAHLRAARDNLIALKMLEGPQSDLAKELALLESLFLNYESAFSATTDRIGESNPQSGFHRRLEAINETIATDAQSFQTPDIQVILWKIAAQEQAYFNTGEQQYLTDARAGIDRLNYLLVTTQFPQPGSNHSTLTAEYLKSLNAALLLEQQVRVNVIVANSINQEIDQIIQAIGDTSQTRAQAARLQLAKTANQSSAALLATTLTALALTIWASFWLGRRILIPITALHQAAARIGAGDLEYSLDLPGEDEFSVVARTFNKMVAQLRDTLTDLEQRVMERTRDLETSNTSLKEKTQSLEMALKQLRASEADYASLLNHLQAGVVVHDADTTISMCNDTACQLLGMLPETIIGLGATEPTWPLLDELGQPLSVEEYPVNQVIATHNPVHNQVVGIHSAAENSIIWVLINAFPSFDDNQVLQKVVVTFINITDRKLAEEELRHRALHDVLTGLPNRTLLIERLEHAIQFTKRHPDSLFAILFIDLNRFKIINDSLGHAIGDHLLVRVADILQSHVRSSDTVSRLGGDEFVILLEQINTPQEVIHVVERIQADLKEPMNLLGYTVFTSASIGIALSNLEYQNGQDVLRDADNAMYRAKAKGQSCYEIFNPEMHQYALRLLDLETNLRHALVKQEFQLRYQPIVDLLSGQLIGFEALVRWVHPKEGVIPPVEFIPLAEETGLIIPLSEWILQEACQQMRQWCDNYPTTQNLKVSVNIAAGLFQNHSFFQTLDQTLVRSGLSARNLKLEVTESVLLKNIDVVLSTLSKLHDRRIEISLDDFGTGYSSLSYLKRFPIDTLKIDKSFVDSLERDQDASIVEAIIQIANSLNMSVIAEGVETLAQQQWLQRLGCDAIQGYLIAPPLSAAEAATWIS